MIFEDKYNVRADWILVYVGIADLFETNLFRICSESIRRNSYIYRVT